MKLASLFKRRKHTYYTVLSRDRYANDGEVAGTYGNYLFESYDDAFRQLMDIEQTSAAFCPVAIVEIKTDKEVSVAKLNYTRTESHPNPTVTFLIPDEA